MKISLSLIVPVLAVLTLAACGDLREDLGLGRSAPDEFAVVDRAPLSMPPDFALRPPEPGAERPQEMNTTQRANDIVFGANAEATQKSRAGMSGAESKLLSSVGADKANPDIRKTVDSEAAEKVVGNKHLVDDILFWRKDQQAGTAVDAAAEAARIKAAKQKGEALNKSPTPVIERQKTGWLGL